MKKIYNLILIIICVLFISSCSSPKKKYVIEFMNKDLEVLESVFVEEGEGLSEFPIIDIEGYYYVWDTSIEELQDIREDKIVIGSKKEYYKNVKYYIDDELFYDYMGLYTKKYNIPELDSKYENCSWVETKNEVLNFTVYIEYELSYTLKSTYNIKFYDGDQELILDINSYDNKEETILPSPKKEGYEFVGWFLSSISLTKYERIEKGSIGDITLYARFIEIEKQNLIELEETPYHFTGIKKIYNDTYGVYTYNPILPSGVNQSLSAYDWSTSDESIATVSIWSSISVKNAGYCVLTGRLKSDSNVFVNSVIKVGVNGIEISTVNEANSIVKHSVKFLGKDNELIDTQTVLDGQFAIAPKPIEYEGLSFNGWDKDIYNITSDLEIRATYISGENKYMGKSFSIIGDSISTYQGYVPSGYATFYPYPTADIRDVNQTWWMETINKLGASLFVNNSYSGSCVATGGSSSSSSKERLEKLVLSERSSDVLLIFMGSNDAHSNSGIVESNFYSKYKIMIDYIYELCKDCEIILITLPISNLYPSSRQVSFNNQIRAIASEYGLKLIDMEAFDIRPHLIDSAHPEYSGMKAMSDFIVSELLK